MTDRVGVVDCPRLGTEEFRGVASIAEMCRRLMTPCATVAEALKRNGYPGFAGRLRGIIEDVAALESDIGDEREG